MNSIDKIWEKIRDKNLRTAMDALGIEITHLGLDAVRGSMPVDHRTVQYFNMLHGGASVLLAETLASIAGSVQVDLSKQYVVGLEINANHVRGVKSGAGKVHGEAKPIHLGGKTQIWAIDIKNDEGKTVCVSRCTLAVLDIAK